MKLPRHYTKEPRVIGIDCDGVLCTGEAWTPEDVINAEPKLEVIAKVNELYETRFIVIYTARRDHLIPATIQWLRKNGVHYHAISNRKIPLDILIDDKVTNVEDFEI